MQENLREIQSKLESMTTIGERIRELRDGAGWTLTDLGDRVGVSRQTVQNWESGVYVPKTDHLSALATAFGVPVSSIYSGFLTPRGNVTTGPGLNFLVPVIAWRDIVSRIAPDDDLAIEAEEWIPCPVICGPRTFALRVRDDSMEGPGQYSYRRGVVIFVDPDASSEIGPGDRVVAKLRDGQVVFGCAELHAGRSLLRFINPSFPPLAAEFEIVGRVIGQFSE